MLIWQHYVQNVCKNVINMSKNHRHYVHLCTENKAGLLVCCHTWWICGSQGSNKSQRVTNTFGNTFWSHRRNEYCYILWLLVRFTKQAAVIYFSMWWEHNIRTAKKESSAVITVSILCLQPSVTRALLLFWWVVSLWSVGSRHSAMLLKGVLPTSPFSSLLCSFSHSFFLSTI